MDAKAEFIDKWYDPKLNKFIPLDRSEMYSDLTSLIQSECEAFGEFIRVNKWQGDMNNTWRQMFTGSSKTTSELYELYELYLTTKNKAR